MGRVLVLLALAPGCMEFGLTSVPTEWTEAGAAPEADPPVFTGPAATPGLGSAWLPDAEADIAVTPDSITTVGFCQEDTREVSLRNEGRSPLTVRSLRLTGGGWTMPSASVPFVLSPGATRTLELTTTGGEGTLVIASDDPDEPSVSVALAATPNRAPTVTLTSPAANTVVPEAGTLALRGRVTDDGDPAEALAVTWSGSADGHIGSATASADGDVRLDWPATGRTVGDQSITVTATDSCGASASDTTAICQDAVASYEALARGGWRYEGDATYLADEDWLVLTEDDRNSVGAAFETSTIVPADAVTVEFGFYIGDGSGADGLSLTALDTTRATSWLGGDTCGMGYGGDASCTDGPALPGWSVEVDTWYDRGVDPTEQDHVAFTFDGQVGAPEVWAALPEMEDTGWHTMRVAVAAPHLTVAIDGVTRIDADIAGAWAFPAHLGFTGATGIRTNWHVVDEVEVTANVCE